MSEGRGSSASPPSGIAASGAGDGDHLVGAPDRDAHAVVLDLDLPHPGLLDDLDELADPLTPRRVDVAQRSDVSRE